MKLTELYNLKLLDYKMNGVREQPDKLLAMLLLPEKDTFEPLMVSEGEFYEAYKKQIDKKIEKIIRDFEITVSDIIEYIEQKDICCNNFEHDKIWFVFCEGFGAMHWGIMYHPEKNAEEIYELVFGSEDLKINDDFSPIILNFYESSKQTSKLDIPVMPEFCDINKNDNGLFGVRMSKLKELEFPIFRKYRKKDN